ncbi:MAG TPA: hypothetical protein VMW49_03200 [Candidatus Dormibacteraeota bacterium]|nr:hypothetical protein [Candidatus Dormibacteraeota bacterium]
MAEAAGGRGWTGWIGRGAGALAVAGLLGACGPVPPPRPRALLRATAAAMRHAPAHLVSGTARAGDTTVRYVLTVTPSGDFAGTVVVQAPGHRPVESAVIATGGQVYVRSPAELARLGITELPGHRSPLTTWVLQAAAVAAQYRANLAPFDGAGLGPTLWRTFSRAGPVRRVRLHGVAVYQLVAGPPFDQAILDVAVGTDRLVRLVVRSDQPVTLVYGAYGIVDPIRAPPPAEVYAPPAPLPGG